MVDFNNFGISFAPSDSLQNSYKLWVALGKIFNTKSKSRNLHLKNQLQNFRKNDLTINDYIVKLTTMVKELREARVSVNDGELSLIALNG